MKKMIKISLYVVITIYTNCVFANDGEGLQEMVCPNGLHVIGIHQLCGSGGSRCIVDALRCA